MQTPQRGSPLVDGDRHHAQGGAPIGPRGETHPATARAQLSALFAWEDRRTRARSSPHMHAFLGFWDLRGKINIFRPLLQRTEKLIK